MGGAALVVLALAAATPTGPCLAVLHPVSAGALAVRGDFADAPCDGALPAFRYDRAARTLRAGRDLAPGERVRGPASLLSVVRPGDHLALRAHVGPVVVEREVEVVEPARAGEKIIVRGADGHVFSAPAPAGRDAT